MTEPDDTTTYLTAASTCCNNNTRKGIIIKTPGDWFPAFSFIQLWSGKETKTPLFLSLSLPHVDGHFSRKSIFLHHRWPYTTSLSHLDFLVSFPKKKHCGQVEMKRECEEEESGKIIPAWPTRTNTRNQYKKLCVCVSHLGRTFGVRTQKKKRERKWAWRGHGGQLDVTGRRLTAQSPKKAHKNWKKKKKKGK